MRRTPIAASFAILAALASTAAGQSWIGEASFGVQVRGSGGALAKARVEILYRGPGGETGGPAPRATSDQGQASFGRLAEGIWSLEVSHPDHLSYVATVSVRRGKRAEIVSSFLEASGTGRNPLRVRLFQPGARLHGTPLVLALDEAQQLEPDDQTETVPGADEEAAAAVGEAPSSADPAEETARSAPPADETKISGETQSRTPSTPAAALLPEAPSPSSEVMPGEASTPPPPDSDQPPPVAAEDLPATVLPVAAAQPEPPEPSDDPSFQSPTPVEVPAEPAPDPPPLPAADPAPEPEPQLVTPPAEAAAEPIAASEVGDPPSSITGASPGEAGLGATQPPGSPAPTDSPPPPPAPGESPAAAPVVPREPPVELPPAPTEAVAAPGVPVVDEPAEPAVSPVPAPAAAEAETLGPAPPVGADGSARSFRDRTCFECKPGEWAVGASARVAGGVGCPADALDRADRAVQEIASRAGGALARYGGDALTPEALALLGASGRAKIDEELGALRSDGSACRLLVLALPDGARLTGFRFEALENGRGGDCIGDQPCPVGDSRWLASPAIERSSGATLLSAVFENRSPRAARLARFVAYFTPPPGWRP